MAPFKRLPTEGFATPLATELGRSLRWMFCWSVLVTVRRWPLKRSYSPESVCGVLASPIRVTDNTPSPS